MWRLLILSALSGLILADRPESGSLIGRLFGDQLDPRLAVNAFHIIRLERTIERLREKLDEAEKVDPEHFIHEMEARVSEIEGKLQKSLLLSLSSLTK